MKDDTIERLGVAFFILCAIVALFLVGLVGWAVIELIQWVTSK
jgi:hypothetical protein